MRAVYDALIQDPNNITLILYGTLVLRDLDKLQRAAERLEQALEKVPGDERLQFNLGLVLHEQDKVDEALTVMEQIIEANPKNADALNYVAYALAEKDSELPRAESLARKAVDLNPHDGYYLDTLGYILHKRGGLSEAEALLAKAFRATNNDPVIVEHYTAVLISNGKHEEAIAILTQLFSDGSEWGGQKGDREAVRRLQALLDRLQDGARKE